MHVGTVGNIIYHLSMAGSIILPIAHFLSKSGLVGEVGRWVSSD